MVFTKDKESLREEYKVVRGSREDIQNLDKVIGVNNQKYYSEALVKIDNEEDYKKVRQCIDEDNIKIPNIEEFMYYYTKTFK